MAALRARSKRQGLIVIWWTTIGMPSFSRRSPSIGTVMSVLPVSATRIKSASLAARQNRSTNFSSLREIA